MRTLLMIFAQKRMAVVLLMGFASGLPLALTAGTLQAWMASLQIDLATIGLFSLVGLPYATKFIWAPILDRYTLPILGRRRGWLAVFQILLILSIVALAFQNPAKNPWLVAAISLLVAFFSASQDIVIDAYRREILKEKEFGVGASLAIMGYRIGMILAGAVALIIADRMPWKTVYLLMALVMVLGFLTTLFADEPKVAQTPKTMRDAVVLPFVDYFSRRGAVEVLIFMIIYKLDVAMTMAMTTPFMMGLGFTKTEIGVVAKGFGMAATIIGALIGGTMMLRISIQRSLWIFGIIQALSGLTYFALAKVGHHYPTMVAAIAVENFCSGLGISAFSAFMMRLCNVRFTATQYALLSSFMALSRYVAAAPSGFIIQSIGWENYFLVCALIGIPGLLMLTRYRRWNLPKEEGLS